MRRMVRGFDAVMRDKEEYSTLDEGLFFREKMNSPTAAVSRASIRTVGVLIDAEQPSSFRTWTNHSVVFDFSYVHRRNQSVVSRAHFRFGLFQ